MFILHIPHTAYLYSTCRICWQCLVHRRRAIRFAFASSVTTYSQNCLPPSRCSKFLFLFLLCVYYVDAVNFITIFCFSYPFEIDKFFDINLCTLNLLYRSYLVFWPYHHIILFNPRPTPIVIPGLCPGLTGAPSYCKNCNRPQAMWSVCKKYKLTTTRLTYCRLWVTSATTDSSCRRHATSLAATSRWTFSVCLFCALLYDCHFLIHLMCSAMTYFVYRM